MSDLGRYSYTFPKEQIATEPASPRDSARLLVYDRGSRGISHSDFRHIADFLPEGAVLVFNQTKVIPARITMTKESGGRVQLLFLSRKGAVISALANKKVPIGSLLTLSSRRRMRVAGCEKGIYTLTLQFSGTTFERIMERRGSMPLPPYIKHSKLSEKKLRTEYQSVFARVSGSVAAPTASLHFTKGLLAELKKKGVNEQFVTLHVGLGTFASVTEEQLRTNTLHHETYRISPATARFLNHAKRKGRPIIAVGTTVVRTLESASDASGVIRKLSGDTDLFIREGYRFKCIDGMITNFHVPGSSLLMLVSAFAGREHMLRVYRVAIRDKYRLFSFGDGMLIR